MKIINRLKQLFSRRRLYNDLFEELQQHLDEKVEELVASGLPRKEATAAARRAFGNVTLIEEDSRSIWRWPSIESLFADVRYAFRVLRKSPGFTCVAVLTLALGIGVNTAIFTAFDAIILRPRAVKDPGRLAFVFRSTLGDPHGRFSYPDYRYYRDHTTSFSDPEPSVSSFHNCFRAALNPLCVLLFPATISRCLERLLSWAAYSCPQMINRMPRRLS